MPLCGKPGLSSLRSLRFAFLLAIGACAATPDQPKDDFVRAAESWEGYPVKEMIDVWGDPDVVGDDKVTWRLEKNKVQCRDVIRRRRVGNEWVEYTVRECVETQAYTYKCRVTANVDSLGDIVEVNALSYRCGVVFANLLRMLDSEYPNNLYKYGEPLGAGNDDVADTSF